VVFFIAVAAGQMAPWAKKKERNYRKEFGDKYKRKRYVMIPGLI
jgi:very-long-chain enoyl-CoA reductase